jgi:antitoxin ParD1/3/4
LIYAEKHQRHPWAGLRLLEEKEAKLKLLRKALKEGEVSGTAKYSLERLIRELDVE